MNKKKMKALMQFYNKMAKDSKFFTQILTKDMRLTFKKAYRHAQGEKKGVGL